MMIGRPAPVLMRRWSHLVGPRCCPSLLPTSKHRQLMIVASLSLELDCIVAYPGPSLGPIICDDIFFHPQIHRQKLVAWCNSTVQAYCVPCSSIIHYTHSHSPRKCRSSPKCAYVGLSLTPNSFALVRFIGISLCITNGSIP